MRDKLIPHEYLGDELVSAQMIAERETVLAARIRRDLSGMHPIFLCVKEGARFFFDDLCDLMAQAKFPFERAYVQTSSYSGNKSSGHVEISGYRGPNVSGRTVVIVEDIIDTALTVKALMRHLTDLGAVRVETCVLLYKKRPLSWLSRMAGLRKLMGLPIIRYVGVTIADHFVVGKGLDYDDFGREHDAVHVLLPEGQNWVDEQNKEE